MQLGPGSTLASRLSACVSARPGGWPRFMRRAMGRSAGGLLSRSSPVKPYRYEPGAAAAWDPGVGAHPNECWSALDAQTVPLRDTQVVVTPHMHQAQMP